MHLLDVNVLIALAWPNHVHHRAARLWFTDIGQEAWATTPITESGFVRVSSNRAAIPTAARPVDAHSVLVQMCTHPGHTFLADDVAMVCGDDVDASLVVAHGQVTDAHLIALAVRHDARLATFDRGLAAIAPKHAKNVIVIPPPR